MKEFLDIFSEFEKIFEDDNWFNFFPTNFSAEFCNAVGVTGIPLDIYLNKNRDYIVEAAVAGYSKDEIDIKFDGNYLYISGKAKDRPAARKYLHTGLKKSNFKTKLTVPKTKYQQNKTSATLENGLLRLVIPSKEITAESKESIKVNIS